MRAYVHDTAEAWLVRHGSMVLFGLRGLAKPNLTQAPALPWGGFESARDGFLCAADEEAEIAKLLVVYRRIPSDAAGAPLAERPALIEQRTREAAALEAEEERLIDEAAKLGIAIEHRPEVQARRNEETHQRRLAEHREERQRDVLRQMANASGMTVDEDVAERDRRQRIAEERAQRGRGPYAPAADVPQAEAEV